MRYRDFVQDSGRWDDFTFRDGDIVISTPPKCGTTWTQRLCSLILGVEPSPERTLAAISPWLDMQTRSLVDVIADLEAQEHRRFIKTHTPLDGLPWDDRVTYVAVARDPRDAAVSWGGHIDNIDFDVFTRVRIAAVGTDDLAELMPDGPPEPAPTDPTERFWHFLEADGMGGVRSTLHHVQTFWDVRDRANVNLFHYADMKADLPGQVRRLANALAVELDEAEVQRVAESAGFERMRSNADTLIPDREADFWKDRAGFFKRGTSGQWHELMADDDLPRYEALLAAAPPDLVRWVHEGGVIPQMRAAAPAG